MATAKSTRTNSTTKPRTTTTSAPRSDASQVKEGVSKARNGAVSIAVNAAERAVDLPVGATRSLKLPLAATHSQAFLDNWRDTKGFVTATVAPDALDGEPVDVVSIHLDFLADRVRRRQVEQLVERFRGHDGHLVVMGDFNCAWSERRRSLDLLLHELKLRPCRDSAAATYPAWRPLVRLDWILVSEGLEFSAYDTLDDRVSDHLGVVAEVHRRRSALQPRERSQVHARRLPSVSLA